MANTGTLTLDQFPATTVFFGNPGPRSYFFVQFGANWATTILAQATEGTANVSQGVITLPNTFPFPVANTVCYYSDAQSNTVLQNWLTAWTATANSVAPQGPNQATGSASEPGPVSGPIVAQNDDTNL